MPRLRALGWGARRIAAELGCSRNTVKRYLEAEGWRVYRRPHRARALDGLETWLAERFRQHRGNADVVRPDLAREHQVIVSLRTIERAGAYLRQQLRAEAKATVEPAPAKAGDERGVGYVKRNAIAVAVECQFEPALPNVTNSAASFTSGGLV
jgi:hypothetical protein